MASAYDEEDARLLTPSGSLSSGYPSPAARNHIDRDNEWIRCRKPRGLNLCLIVGLVLCMVVLFFGPRGFQSNHPADRDAASASAAAAAALEEDNNRSTQMELRAAIEELRWARQYIGMVHQHEGAHQPLPADPATLTLTPNPSPAHDAATAIPATAPVPVPTPTSAPPSAPSPSRSASSLVNGVTSGRVVELHPIRRWSDIDSDSPAPTPTRTVQPAFHKMIEQIPTSAAGLRSFHACVQRQLAAGLKGVDSQTGSDSLIRVAVVTSIMPSPSVAMLNQAQLDREWCVVVIGDAISPTHARYIENTKLQFAERPLPVETIEGYTDAEYKRVTAHIAEQDRLVSRYHLPLTISPTSDSASLAASAALAQSVADRIAYIDVAEQALLPYATVAATPMKSFSRKNIGFLLAYHAGADVVFDFDDDNLYYSSSSHVGLTDLPLFTESQRLPIPHAGELLNPSAAMTPNTPAFKEATRNMELHFDFHHALHEQKEMDEPPSRRAGDGVYQVWNPYPSFGLDESWPRGYPLPLVGASIKAAAASRVDLHSRSASTDSSSASASSVAHLECVPLIQQFLANIDPDVDAVWRMTSDDFEAGPGTRQNATDKSDTSSTRARAHAPMDEAESAMMDGGTYFAPFSAAADVASVQLPPSSYAPYNAQATVHLRAALFASLLPQTVHGRVSDIWRSYFFETLNSYLLYSNPSTRGRKEAQAPTGDIDPPAVGLVNSTLAGGSSSSGRLQPGCVVFGAPNIAHFRNPHVYHADFMSEKPLYETTPALLQFLQERRFGQAHCLLRRWRAQQQADQTDELAITSVPILDLMTLLWTDLYEVGVLEAADVQYARAWADDLRAVQSPSSWSDDSDSSVGVLSNSPSTGDFGSLAPPLQTHMAVCVTANFAIHPTTLEIILPQLTRMHQHIAIMAPKAFREADIKVQAIIEAIPQAAYIYVDVDRGWLQQLSLHTCTDYYLPLMSGVNASGFDFDFFSSRRKFLPAFSASPPLTPVTGVFHMADDAWVNFTSLLLPAPAGHAAQHPLHSSWMNVPLKYRLNMTDCRVTPPVIGWSHLKPTQQLPELCQFVQKHMPPAEWDRTPAKLTGIDVLYLSAADGQVDYYRRLVSDWDLMFGAVDRPKFELILVTFVSLAARLAGHEVQLQGVPRVIPAKAMRPMQIKYLWGDARYDAQLIASQLESDRVVALHPIKLSSALSVWPSAIPSSRPLADEHRTPADPIYRLYIDATQRDIQRWTKRCAQTTQQENGGWIDAKLC